MEQRVRRSAHFPLSAQVLWEFIFRSEVWARWTSGAAEGDPGDPVRLRVGEPVVLSGEQGPRHGRVARVDDDYGHLEITMDAGSTPTRLTIDVQQATERPAHRRRPPRRPNRQKHRSASPSGPAPARADQRAGQSTLTITETVSSDTGSSGTGSSGTGSSGTGSSGTGSSGTGSSDTGIDAVAADAELGRYWDAALMRLHDIVHRIDRRRRAVRQAVIVIHGIGEQLPGATLAALVGSGVLDMPDAGTTFATTSAPPVTSPPDRTAPAAGPAWAGDEWVKPDLVSGSFELRRVTIDATRDRPTTDAFEMYWASMVRDTTMSQVLAWIRSVLLRLPAAIPKPLRRFYFLAWGALVVVLAAMVLLVVFQRLSYVEAALTTGVAAGVITFAGKIFKPLGNLVMLNYLGDAARYLRPEPDNIAHRQEIRTAGVDLLVALHESGRYDRIVVLGHSLGSVIAYDILTFAWIRMNRQHRSPSRASFPALRRLEAMRRVAPPAKRVARRLDWTRAQQDMQHAAWLEHRRNTQPWLVTDLVTVGCPLTYSDLLLARGAQALRLAQEQRILPTSPPVRQEMVARDLKTMQRFSFDTPYRQDRHGPYRTFTVPHHAALFAVTRWTNLYFTFDKVFRGDPVGGPVGPLFGEWIIDTAMPSPKTGPFGFAHTLYWAKVADDPLHDVHLRSLHDALHLECKRELLDLNAAIPAHLFL